MKQMIVVTDLGPARWIELPDAIVVSAAWVAEQGGIAATQFAHHPIIGPEGPKEAPRED